jgi:hypothetical protein
MKEARAIANGVFAFIVFVLIYGFSVSGHVTSSAGGPRFLKMEINEGSHGGERVSFSVPFSFVHGGLRLAALGKVRRELDLHIHDQVEAELLRDIWKEVSEKPDGTEVVRELEDSLLSFTKKGEELTFSISKRGSEERVTIRLPLRILQSLADEEESLDVDRLIDELPGLKEGELLNVESRDGTIRIWIE